MLGSLFRLGMLATLVGGSTYALIGPERLKDYFNEGKDQVLSALDDAQSMEAKLKKIQKEISGLDKESARLRRDAISSRVESERLRNDLEERERSLARRGEVLDKVSALLAQNKGEYVIGRVVYSRDEVERDAAEKLSLYNVQKQTLASMRETLSTKEKAHAIAEENVGRADALRAELQSKVQLLEAQLQKFRAKETFAATVQDIVDTSALDSDLARAREMITEFEKDLDVQQRMLDEQLKAGSDQPKGGIDYDAMNSTGDEDLVGQIRHALSGTNLSVSDPVGAAIVIGVPAVH